MTSPDPSAPPAPPTEPTFRLVDDIAWTPVQRQRNSDGSESVIRERWPIIRPGFLSAYVVYEPGMVVRRHGHRSNHVVILLDGGAWIGGDWGGARATPKVEGLTEVVTRFDGIPATDGEPGVLLAAAIDAPDFESVRVRLAPHAVFTLGRDHAHRLVLVTAGAVVVGERTCPTGTHLEVPAGCAIAPMVGGPDGATLHFLADG